MTEDLPGLPPHDGVSFVRGAGVHLYDADGNEYLDVYNNVPSVGHSHPHVARR